MQDVQTVQAEILLKDSSKMLYYTSHCQMCDLNKQINTLLSLIFNSYLNSVTKKKRSNNVQADEWPFTTGATKHWDIPGALLLPRTAFFHQPINFDNLHWVWKAVWILKKMFSTREVSEFGISCPVDSN